MTASYFIAAVGTPLDGDERLHSLGLRSHLDDQAATGMDGILVAGTMGMMQLLSDKTYQDLVSQSAELWSGRGEFFVGVGDASFARTRDRLHYVNQFPIDVAVVLTPYFMKFSQEQLVGYFEALAEESKAPLFLYDLPQTTGTALALDTVRRLSKHPNIRGIKCSGDVAQARALIDSMADSDFRIITAQPLIVDVLLRHGIPQHLDGVFAMFPAWVKSMKEAVSRDDWQRAAELSQQMAKLLPRLHHYNALSAMSVILNARGIAGNYAPRPYPTLSSTQAAELLAEPTLIAIGA